MAKKEILTIKEPDYRRTVLGIEGVTPLLCDRMSQETIDGMVETKENSTKAKKERDRMFEFEQSCYILDSDAPEDAPGKYGFPASGFRLAAKDAARMTNIKMTEANQAFIPTVEMVPLLFGKRRLRIDRVGGNTTPRTTAVVRAEFVDWSCQLPIEWDNDFLTLKQICNLLSRAGRSVGIGAWRVIKHGLHGQFRIASEG